MGFIEQQRGVSYRQVKNTQAALVREQRYAKYGLAPAGRQASDIFKCFLRRGVAGQNGNLFIEDSAYHGPAELDF